MFGRSLSPSKFFVSCLSHRHATSCVTFLCVLLSLNLYPEVWASSSDLLVGTDEALKATLQGTGKMYLYLAEGIVSLVMYIKTKNIMVLCGIIIVSIFFNIMLKMAGV